MVQIIISQDEENRTFLHQYIEEIEYLQGRPNTFPQRISVFIALNSVSNKKGVPPERNPQVIKILAMKNSKGSAVEIQTVEEKDPIELNLDFSLLDQWTDYVFRFVEERTDDSTTWLDYYSKWSNFGIKASIFGGALPFGAFIMTGSSNISAWISGLAVSGIEFGKIVSIISTYWGLAPTSLAGFSSWAISLLFSIFVKKDQGLIADVAVSLGGMIHKPPRTPYNEDIDAMSVSTYNKYRKLLLDPLEK